MSCIQFKNHQTNQEGKQTIETNPQMIHGQEEKLQARMYTEKETVKPSLFANFSA